MTITRQISIMLWIIVLLMNSQAFAEQDFILLEHGQRFVFRETDGTGNEQQFTFWEVVKLRVPCMKQRYMACIKDSDKSTITLLRSSNSEAFSYIGNCSEIMIWQNAPIGTTWEYPDDDGDIIYVTIDSVNETVVVPAGTFTGCLKFHKTRPADSLEWFEWVQPGFMMVKMEDYSRVPHSMEELVEYSD